MKFHRAAFASHPARRDGLPTSRPTSRDRSRAASGSPTPTRARSSPQKDRLTATGSLAGYKYEGNRPYKIALNYEAQVLVLHEGGTIEADGQKIAFKDADTVDLAAGRRHRFRPGPRQRLAGRAAASGNCARLDAAARSRMRSCWPTPQGLSPALRPRLPRPRRRRPQVKLAHRPAPGQPQDARPRPRPGSPALPIWPLSAHFLVAARRAAGQSARPMEPKQHGRPGAATTTPTSTCR